MNTVKLSEWLSPGKRTAFGRFETSHFTKENKPTP